MYINILIMKFTCTQENLLRTLDVVTPVTGKNLAAAEEDNSRILGGHFLIS